MKTRRILAFLLIACLCVSLMTPVAAIEATPAQTPDIETMEAPQTERTDIEASAQHIASDGTVYCLGALEDDYPAPALRGEWASPALFGTIPASYSLRSLGQMTSVKNQNPYGDCWAFASVASMESNILKKYGETTDLSEMQIVYFASVRDSATASAGGGTAGDIVQSSYNLLNAGGNGNMSMNALGNWLGAAPQSVLSQDVSADRSKVSSRSVSADLAYAQDTFHLQNAHSVNSTANPEAVKAMIMNCGAGYLSFIWDDPNYNSTYYSYYSPNTNFTDDAGGHAVTVCGWDDNFSRYKFNSDPGSNGAWLCKNSWNSGWGDGGYFWISYKDAGRLESRYTVYFYDVAPAASDEHLYQYDGGNSTSSFRYTSLSAIYGANIFTAQRSESIQSVSFYTNDSSLTAAVYVYTGVTAGDPSSGTLAGSKIGVSISYAGYHTIELPESVAVENGQKFSVVLKLSHSASSSPYMAYDAEYSNAYESSAPVSYAGQSFYSADGSSWTDCSTARGNLRIKATTISLTPTYIRGDANYDSVVSVKDPVVVARYIAGAKNLDATQKRHADADANGAVNVTDVLWLKQAVAGQRTLPAY